MVARRENWDGEEGTSAKTRVARIRGALELEMGAGGENGQTDRLGMMRRAGGLSGQGSGGLDRVSRDIETMKKDLELLLEKHPTLRAELSEYVEAWSLVRKSTSEVK